MDENTTLQLRLIDDEKKISDLEKKVAELEISNGNLVSGIASLTKGLNEVSGLLKAAKEVKEVAEGFLPSALKGAWKLISKLILRK